MKTNLPLTSRRGFVAAAGFGMVGLYGLWAAYGAAPLPFVSANRRTGDGAAGGHGAGHGAPPASETEAAEAAAGHGGHGAGGGMDPAEFRRLTEEFATRYRQADGSVWPGRRAVAAVPPAGARDHTGEHFGRPTGDDLRSMVTAAGPTAPVTGHAQNMEHMDGQQMPTMDHGAMPMNHGAMPGGQAMPMMDHGAMPGGQGMPTMDHGGTAGHGESSAAGPHEVYLMAYQWGFEPDFLRLDLGVPHRFRMMAVDVSHGASLQLGPASRIVRLRRNALVEQTVTFQRPGTYLVYCTLYCGAGHDRMFGRIVVA
jgi:plastocyanin